GGALLTGLVFAALVIPVFAFRHYVRDGGKFPDSLYATGDPGSVSGAGSDSGAGSVSGSGAVASPVRRAGARPYLVLAGGVLMVIIGQLLAH
ncbi:MAG: hypothetical protein QOD82_644, partial [Pseudonocardiales bacterium]|nr:hypothetical protein [Pseudonocardiales bacterium]